MRFDQDHVATVAAILTPSGFGKGSNGTLSGEHREWWH
jgi:hypothetical protein